MSYRQFPSVTELILWHGTCDMCRSWKLFKVTPTYFRRTKRRRDFRRATGEKCILLLSPPRLSKYRYRSLRLAKTLPFTANSNLNSLQREAKVRSTRSTRFALVLSIKVCANVCAKQNGRLGVARKLLKRWCTRHDSNVRPPDS